MKGWQIFKHSFNLVITNLEQALKLSLVLYLVQCGFTVYSALNPLLVAGPDASIEPVLNAPAVFPTIALFVASVVASLWIAVAWHRFALTGETSSGWIPNFHGRTMLRYLGYSILIAVICIIGVVLVSIPFGLIAVGIPVLAALAVMVPVALFLYVAARLGVILPAVALDETMALSSAWNATKGEGGTIFSLVGIGLAFSLLMAIPSLLNDDPSSVINVVYSLVVNWFATIVGISVLTTLYGHFVEKRPID